MAENKTYLVFLQNLKSGEEFVAPVTAASHDEALLMIGEKYPPRLYKMQTFYTMAAMERIMDDVKRWPGVASAVQPMVEQLSKRVVTGGPLPTLPDQQAAPAYAGQATSSPMISAIEAIRAMSGGAGLGARMETIREASVAAPTPAKATPRATAPVRTVSASVISRGGVPVAQPAASSASVLDVLKALRG